MAPRSLADRFWSKVSTGESETCWPWLASRKDNGYGQAYDIRTNKPVGAHRLAWELAYGPIPDGLSVLHACDNPPCVNPAHLFLGSPRANSMDMVSKSRQAFGERNGLSRLTKEKVLEARTLRAGGLTLKAIAQREGVSLQTIHHAISGRTWSHV